MKKFLFLSLALAFSMNILAALPGAEGGKILDCKIQDEVVTVERHSGEFPNYFFRLKNGYRGHANGRIGSISRGEDGNISYYTNNDVEGFFRDLDEMKLHYSKDISIESGINLKSIKKAIVLTLNNEVIRTNIQIYAALDSNNNITKKFYALTTTDNKTVVKTCEPSFKELYVQ